MNVHTRAVFFPDESFIKMSDGGAEGWQGRGGTETEGLVSE